MADEPIPQRDLCIADQCKIAEAAHPARWPKPRLVWEGPHAP